MSAWIVREEKDEEQRELDILDAELGDTECISGTSRPGRMMRTASDNVPLKNENINEVGECSRDAEKQEPGGESEGCAGANDASMLGGIKARQGRENDVLAEDRKRQCPATEICPRPTRASWVGTDKACVRRTV